MRHDDKSRIGFLAVFGILFLLSTSSVEAGIIAFGDVNPDPTSAGDADISGMGVFFVGNIGDGSVTVDGGSQLTSGLAAPPPQGGSPDGARVGATPGIEGSITVEGAGSTWVNNGGMTVGGPGKGSVTAKDGGAIFFNGIATVGLGPGPQGIVSVDNGSLTVGDVLLLGAFGGNGILEVSNGATVNVLPGPFNPRLSLGQDPGSRGEVHISGSGSTVTTTSTEVHRGALTVENGGTFSSDILEFGIVPDSGGDALITGDDSTVVTTTTDVYRGALTVEDGGALNGDNISIGRGIDGDGDGTLNVYSGGTVNSRFLNVARAGGQGRATIDGSGSSVNLSGEGAFLTVGRDDGSVGTYRITNQGKTAISDTSTTASGFQAGRNEGSDGTIGVEGTGSELSVNSANVFVRIGRSGKGALNVSEGGQVNVTSTTGIGSFRVGSDPTGDGEVNVQGIGSKLSVKNLSEGIEVGKVGKGKLTVADGGTIETNKVQVGPQGTLVGNGTIIGDVYNMGGTVAPGLSPGVMTIDGSLFGDTGSIFDFEIGGTGSGDFDQISATGFAALVDVILNITFIDDFMAAAGDMFDLITADQGGIYQIAQVNFFGASADDFILNSHDGTLTLTAVPEPSTLMLFGIALAALVWVGRRRLNS